MKTLKNEIEKQMLKVSKKERSRLNRLNRVEDATCRPSVFLSGKDKNKKRRKGSLAADIRRGAYD